MALPKAKSIGKFFLTLLVSVLVYLAAAVIAGVISALSANIDVTAVTVIFDPQITIAYLLVFYFTNHFYRFNANQTYVYFVITLLLSFTTNFIQGALVMLTLLPLLKKLRLISSPTPPSAN